MFDSNVTPIVQVWKCIRAALLVPEEQKGSLFHVGNQFSIYYWTTAFTQSDILLMDGIQIYSRVCTCFLITRKRFHLHGFPHN